MQLDNKSLLNCATLHVTQSYREIGHYHQAKPATDSSLRFVALCGEFKKPQDEGGQVPLARINPNTVIGPEEELHIVHLGTDSGVDVRVPSTMYPG